MKRTLTKTVDTLRFLDKIDKFYLVCYRKINFYLVCKEKYIFIRDKHNSNMEK